MPGLPITLGFLLNDTARLLRKRFEQNAREFGLTRSQWQVLAYLARNEGIQQSALADILDVEPITLARMLDRLEAASLVERRNHPTDRRVWQLFLRPAANELIASMQELGDLTRAEALAGVSEADRETLTRVLTQMKANLLVACNAPQPKRKAGHG
ncbi:MAG: MarR family transcriptional regulator [Methylobacteriaceae bacterium]|nr:MarR family transcriptional regulator [Methylobacteriaceae bacterium]